MPFGHVLRALRAVTMRELLKFVQQRGRLLSALVAIWTDGPPLNGLPKAADVITPFAARVSRMPPV